MKKVLGRKSLLSVAALVLIAVIVGTTGTYPVLSVNGSAVSAKRLNLNYDAAALYYGNISEMLGGEENTALPQFSESETRADVLTQLVEAALIHKGVYSEAGDSAEELIRERAEKYAGSADLMSAAKDLYGMEYDDFMREVILPQAERDILAGRLFLKGENIEDWLLKTKSEAEVRIFRKNFSWTGERVEVK